MSKKGPFYSSWLDLRYSPPSLVKFNRFSNDPSSIFVSSCHSGQFYFTFFQFSGISSLWFGKPMVCMRIAFHENDGNHENDKNDEDNSDSYKQGAECWIRGNYGKPQK